MAVSIENRIDEYWDWVAWALYLLLSVDLLTTIYAAQAVGTAAEANPMMRLLMSEGPVMLVAANIAAGVLAAVMFYGLMELLRLSPEPVQDRYLRGVELWLGLLVAAGLAVFANNLMVIVAGQSLL
jgi:hypothetical protein